MDASRLSPRSGYLPSILIFLLALTGCGGGGGGGGGQGVAAPSVSIGSLTYDPKGAYIGGPANVTVSGTLISSGSSPLSALQTRVLATNGQVVGQAVIPLQQGTNPTGLLTFSITLAVSQLAVDAYTIELAVTTPSGGVSNALRAPFSVLPNPWSALPGMPTPRTGFAVAESSGRIYVIGGGVDSAASSRVVEVYDPASNTWSAAPQPTVARAGASAAATGGRVYLLGGSSNTSPNGVSEVEVFDPTLGAWTAGPTLPTPRRDAAVAVVNSAIYLIGGVSGSSYLTTVETLDPSTNSWGVATSLPQGRASSAAVGANGGVYLSGGRTASAVLDASLLAYNPGTSVWNTFNGFNRMIYTRANHALVAFNGNLLGIAGETNTGSSSVTSTVEAAPAANLSASPLQWRLRAPMPQASGYARAAVIGGKIYVVTPSQTWLYDPALDVL